MNSPVRKTGYRPALAIQLQINVEQCWDCKLCVRECAFLKEYGSLKEIAKKFVETEELSPLIGYECSLCGLCSAVCPACIDPTDLFVELRREAVDRGLTTLSAYSPLRWYERIGSSALYTCYNLPPGCDTVLFPGCTFSGSRAGIVRKLYEHLQQKIPALGLVLDCCLKLSHDLGKDEWFRDHFEQKQKYLLAKGVSSVIVLCPSCFKIFDQYGSPLQVRTAYELLDTKDCSGQLQLLKEVSVHDPCVLRGQREVQQAVRSILDDLGMKYTEMAHHREKTICCGEGGGVAFARPEFADNWLDLRRREASGKTMITYCAGCVNYLGEKNRIHHILDLMFEPDTTGSGSVQVVSTPLTYLKRLQLKNCFSAGSDRKGVVAYVISLLLKLLGRP